MSSRVHGTSGLVIMYILSTIIIADSAYAKNLREHFTGIFCQTIEEDFETHKSKLTNYIYKNAESLEKAKTAPIALLLSAEDEKRLFAGGAPSCGTKIGFKGQSTSSKRVRVQASTFLEVTTNEAEAASLKFAPSGEQKTIAVLVDFQDKSVPCQSSDIQNMVFDGDKSVNAAYHDASHGSVYLTGDVVRVKVNRPLGQVCNPNGWANAAETLVKSAGYSLANYNRRIFFLPENLPCWWGGFGHVGGVVTRSWVRSCSTGIAIHEIGHNLSMHHASHMNSEGGIVEYGDASDPMGTSGIVGFNAPHKEQMEWVSSQLLTKSGTHKLSGLNLDPKSVTFPQILKFTKPDSGEYYFVSFRSTSGFDAYQNYPYMNKVQIHAHRGGSVQTRHLVSLTQGETFTDNKNGILVSVESISQDTATVNVQLAGTAVMPSVSVAPPLKVGAPGIPQSYTLEVTNKDLDLPATDFKVEFVGPAGWSALFDSSTMMLKAGASGSTIVNVTPPQSAKNGTYEFTIKLTDGVKAIHNVFLKARLQVVIPDITPPSVMVKYPTSSLVMNPKFLKQISIICSATDPGQITSTKIFINGLEQLNRQFSSPSSFASISQKFSESSFIQGWNSVICEFTDRAGNVGSSSSKFNKL